MTPPFLAGGHASLLGATEWGFGGETWEAPDDSRKLLHLTFRASWIKLLRAPEFHSLNLNSFFK